VIDVRHFTDPGCPWAWSASPALSVLHWRYGDQLRWRLVMIGLTERGGEYARRGYTGERQARGYRSFRRRGMPFAVEPRDHMHGTWPMCRAVVATRLTAPDREWSVFRALQVAQFTTTLDLETEAGVHAALERVPGLDAAAVMRAATSPETEAAFAADRDESRSAAGGQTEFQGKSATTPDGLVRFTAPSLTFETEDGRALEGGGFQPVEAYDVLIANLDPTLRRREPATDVAEVLDVFSDGVTTAEVAAVMAPNNAAPDLEAAEDALISAAAAGQAKRVAVGHDALWAAADRAADRLLATA
jgi:protein-disulfide isomerase-like protein with CxxC motif